VKAKRTYVDYIRDMLEYAEKARQFVGDLSLEEFRRDEQKTLATIKALEIIGEGGRHIPKGVRDRYAEVPWKKIVGIRNIVVHEYFGVDAEVIWKTVRNDLPPLCSQLAGMLADLEEKK